MKTPIPQLGDMISSLTLKEAAELSQYLKEVHKIEPTKQKTVEPQPKKVDVVKTQFEVQLTGYSGNRLAVIRALRAVTGLELRAAKNAIDELPFAVATEVTQEEADRLEQALVEAGGTVEVI